MSSIQVFNLSPVGSNLFQDTESFLDELTDQELGGIEGGIATCYRHLISRLTIRSPQLTKFRAKFGKAYPIGITYTAKTLVSGD